MVLQVRPSYVSKQKRQRRNHCERRFERLASKSDWRITKRGWPDFLCWDEDGPFAVEVKPRTQSGRLKKLRKEQVETLTLLQELGLRCFVSDGETLETVLKLQREP